jgi:hypothetical protein
MEERERIHKENLRKQFELGLRAMEAEDAEADRKLAEMQDRLTMVNNIFGQ